MGISFTGAAPLREGGNVRGERVIRIGVVGVGVWIRCVRRLSRVKHVQRIRARLGRGREVLRGAWGCVCVRCRMKG